MDAYEEAVQIYRDALRQIAVHDYTPGMADAAEMLLAGPSQIAMDTIVAGAFESAYGGSLLDAMTTVVMLKPTLPGGAQ